MTLYEHRVEANPVVKMGERVFAPLDDYSLQADSGVAGVVLGDNLVRRTSQVIDKMRLERNHQVTEAIVQQGFVVLAKRVCYQDDAHYGPADLGEVAL